MGTIVAFPCLQILDYLFVKMAKPNVSYQKDTFDIYLYS